MPRASWIPGLLVCAAAIGGQACMRGSAKPKDDAGVSGNDGAVAADSGTTDPCARFAVKVERMATCDACAYPANCECVLGGIPSCNFGRCVTGVNCAEACKNPPDSEAFFAELLALQECVGRALTPLCTRDDECAGGKCVNQGTGLCQTGSPGSPCLNGSHCFSVACVTYDTGEQYCADGAPGAACNTDAHCSFSGSVSSERQSAASTLDCVRTAGWAARASPAPIA